MDGWIWMDGCRWMVMDGWIWRMDGYGWMGVDGWLWMDGCRWVDMDGWMDVDG